ncbi:MAG TPA: elongation factor Ts [Gammaproteobacteria bacterium]|jgi:elongation factor Ts|nr:elongation factor Ts [Gammaproteobacteria bacterium]
MAITASMVKELRERTGAGMMECKKALTEADGNIETAIEELRKRGAAQADKKAGRIAAEGLIVAASQNDVSVLLEVNCETDFVAKDENFVAFANLLGQSILAQRPESIDALASLVLDSGISVEETRQNLIAKIGENISVRRFEVLSAGEGQLSIYQHGARIAVAVLSSGGDEDLGRDIAMHVAASRPLCVSADQVDPKTVEKERGIYLAQAEDSGKPPEIMEKMVEGRVRKFLGEVTLLGQPFVKDPDQTVGKLLTAQNATVSRFVRYEVGEGLEKKQDDFVAEVMAQAKGD